VNASVALKWHLTHDPFALQALDLLNDWRKGDLDLLAPAIFFAEISHALVRAVRRGRLSPDEAKTVLSDLLVVAVQMFPTWLLVQRAMEIALQHQQSAYGCLVDMSHWQSEKALNFERATNDWSTPLALTSRSCVSSVTMRRNGMSENDDGAAKSN